MGEWVFGARERETEQAAAALSAGQSVMISGEAGIGKSRLARVVVDQLAIPSSLLRVFGGARALQNVPFGVFSRLVVPAVGYRLVETEDPNDPEVVARRLGAVRDALMASEPDATAVGDSGSIRVVLLIDDIQWLDPLSAALVLQLATSRDATVIATRRTGEPVPDAIRQLRRHACCDKITLGPLSLAEAQEVLHANLGRIERQSLHELHDATRGNPLLLEDLVGAATESGALVARGGSWYWNRTVPSAALLTDLVEERIARLKPEDLEALALVAVGEPLPLSVAYQVTEREALGRLEREGLLTRQDASEEVRVSHPLYGDIIRAGLGPLERAALCGQLCAEASAVSPPPDPARIAVWSFEAGRSVDPAHLVTASRLAITIGDSNLALRLAERALDAGDRPEALIALGRSLVVRGRTEEAARILTPLLDRPGMSDEQRVDAGIWLLTGYGSDTDAAQRAVAVVLDHLQDRAAGDLLVAQLAAALVGGTRWREVDAALVRPLAVSDRDDVAMRALQPFVISLATSGRCTEAADLASGALGKAILMADATPDVMRWVFVCCVTSGMLDGRLTEVQGLLDLAGAVSAPAGAEGYFSMIRGKVALLQGRVDVARTELQGAVDRLDRFDAGGWYDWAMALLAEALALTAESSTTASRRGVRERSAGVTGDVFLDLDARRARAWSLLATGDRRACLTELAAVADRSAELGHVPYHAMALHDSVRLGATVYDRLEEVLGDVQSRWAAPMSAHNRGRRAGDVELLEEGATGFEAMGADLLAAECWATTARVAAGRGLGARARRASARSSRLAAACGGVWTPALGLPDVLPELTARELQVARRASSGATSREIAEGLGISVRTVDNLLGRAYTKLGISRRDELLSVLPDQ